MYPAAEPSTRKRGPMCVGEAAHREVGADAARVREGEERVVGATPPGRRIDDSAAVSVAGPKSQRLVDEMAAEVEGDGRRPPRGARLLPAPLSAGATIARSVDSKRSTSTERAAASSLRTVRKSLSQRRFWKTISGSAAAAAAGAMSCSASATEAANGLSMTSAAPAASADRPCSRWTCAGDPRARRGRRCSASSSSGDATISVPGCSWAACARRAGSLVEMTSSAKRERPR